MSGQLIAAAAVTTTTTTGTGALTISNSVPTGQPLNSTTFAAAFAPGAVYPRQNIFYVIQDASANYEVGYGTLLSATSLSRDFVIFSGTLNTTSPYVPMFIQNPTAGFLNLASGTAYVYSNPTVQALFTPYMARVPNFTGNDVSFQNGGLTSDIMHGAFTGTLTDGTGTASLSISYDVSSAGIVQFYIPAGTVSTAGTTLSITGVPSYLSNVTSQSVPCFVVGTAAGGVTVPGMATLAGGASPTATGTITFEQYTAATFPALLTATFTASVSRGTIAQVLTFNLH